MTSYFPPQVTSAAASVPTYANFSSLPLSGTQGDLAITLDTNTLYEYTGTVWAALGMAGSTLISVADTAKIDLTNTAGTLSATVVSGSLVNSDVNASAAIALTKLATVTASRALVSDGAGAVSASGVTAVELGYVSGVSSAIQTQINTKAPTASPTFTGTITVPVGPGVMKASVLGTVSASAITNSDVSAAAAIDVTKLATGTSNQLLGANAAGSANEFKTLSVGTTGSDFAITHSAGGVAFNLPDAGAAARGAVTTGTQTLAGAKTLSGITTVSNATASTSATTGALVVAGGLGVGGSVVASDAGFRVQTGNTTGGTKLDQASGTTYLSAFGGTAQYGTLAFRTADATESGGLITPMTISQTNGTLAGSTVSILSTKTSTATTTGALTVAGGVGVAGQLSALAGQIGTVGTAAGAINISQGAGTTLIDNYGPTPTGNYGSLNFNFRYSDGGAVVTPFTITPTNFTVSSTNAKITAAYGNTTAAAPNVFVASDGTLSRATTAIAPTASPTFTGTVTLPTGTGVLHSSSGGVVSSSTIVNADVDASAAIDGSKIVAASGSVSGVVTTGTQTIAGAKTLSGITTVSNTTDSTSTTTGALVVSGGMGVAGALNAGNTITTTNAGFTSSTSSATGTARFENGAGITYVSALGGTGQYGTLAFRSFDAAYGGAGTVMQIGQTAGTLATSRVTVNATQASTSTSTGALTVAGGVGIAGQLSVGTCITFNGDLTSFSANTGYLTKNGSTSYFVSSGPNTSTNGDISLYSARSDGTNPIQPLTYTASTNSTVINGGYTCIPSAYALTTGAAVNMYVAGDGSMYRSTSALKYKENIVDLPYGLDAVRALRPVFYTSNCDYDDKTKIRIGIIADEADAVIPELTTHGIDNEIEGFQYDRLTAVLVKAIQELEARLAKAGI